ncbi:MAG: hypothetical protein M1820_010372 [Bogoriella megaspora]|nr:MAG: hypothetical protein M1820_010372 [Bogoriella megaspora]
MGPTTDEEPSSSYPRKPSISGAPQIRPGEDAPTTFFLKKEEEMDPPSSINDNEASTETVGGVQDSSYGVESLEDAIGSSQLLEQVDNQNMGSKSTILGKRKSPKNPVHPNIIAAAQRIISSESPRSGLISSQTPSPRTGRRSSQASISQPLTPLRLSPTIDSAAPSTPKTSSIRSVRLSDDEESVVEDSASQAVDSSNEDEEAESIRGKQDISAGPTPELVMPSIKMPTRRPFTERGKQLGKLKILVAGPTGSGKSSLLRSILQCCEDIVHVDPTPFNPPPVTPDIGKENATPKVDSYQKTAQILELHASTRAYPSWWTDISESKTVRRRKSSSGDMVLERNLCFIDTPGHTISKEQIPSTDPVLEYIDHQLHRNAAITSMTDMELLSILSGNGGVQVDIVLYVFANRLQVPAGIEYIKRLCSCANVIPIIGKADLLSNEDVTELKKNIMHELKVNKIQPFLFGKDINENQESSMAQPPFAVTSVSDRDADTMDASLLMSSEYIQPLMPSELYTLVDRVFEPENAAWLRHSAAAKFLQWRKTRNGQSMLIDRPIEQPSVPAIASNENNSGISSPDLTLSPMSSHVLLPTSISQSLSPSAPTSPKEPAYGALTQLNTQAHREERFGQVRLAKWAADLQRSLRNEREKYEKLARTERETWLVEKLEECNAEAAAEKMGTIIKTRSMTARRHRARLPISRMADPRDPLGLLGFADRVGQNGWMVVQVIGGCGVAGALAVWFWRSWDSNSGGGWEQWWSGVSLWSIIGR